MAANFSFVQRRHTTIRDYYPNVDQQIGYGPGCNAVEKLDRFGVKLKETGWGEQPCRTQRACRNWGGNGIHSEHYHVVKTWTLALWAVVELHRLENGRFLRHTPLSEHQDLKRRVTCLKYPQKGSDILAMPCPTCRFFVAKQLRGCDVAAALSSNVLGDGHWNFTGIDKIAQPLERFQRDQA